MHEAPSAEELVASALAEDLGVPVSELLGARNASLLARDVTSWAVLPEGERFAGVIRARQDAVVCGLPLVAAVYDLLSRAAALDVPVDVYPLVAEGAEVRGGDAVAEVEGEARAVLAGERTALNLLMTLSGIATESLRWTRAAGGMTVTDTRKTLPGLRALSKYAVRVGGAENHRSGLHDMVLVKDNHLRRAGGVAEAVRRSRERAPGLKVEVEAETVGQAADAARAGADIVLLDNMEDESIRAAVSAVRDEAARAGRTVLTEASGGITFERLPRLAATGVDRVSASALTLAPPRDFGLDEEA